MFIEHFGDKNDKNVMVMISLSQNFMLKFPFLCNKQFQTNIFSV